MIGGLPRPQPLAITENETLKSLGITLSEQSNRDAFMGK